MIANQGHVLVTTREGAGRVREAADAFKLTRPNQLSLASGAGARAEWMRLVGPACLVEGLAGWWLP